MFSRDRNFPSGIWDVYTYPPYAQDDDEALDGTPDDVYEDTTRRSLDGHIVDPFEEEVDS